MVSALHLGICRELRLIGVVAILQGLKMLNIARRQHEFYDTTLWHEITHLYLNFDISVKKPPLNLGHGWVITSHCLRECNYLPGKLTIKICVSMTVEFRDRLVSEQVLKR